MNNYKLITLVIVTVFVSLGFNYSYVAKIDEYVFGKHLYEKNKITTGYSRTSMLATYVQHNVFKPLNNFHKIVAKTPIDILQSLRLHLILLLLLMITLGVFGLCISEEFNSKSPFKNIVGIILISISFLPLIYVLIQIIYVIFLIIICICFICFLFLFWIIYGTFFAISFIGFNYGFLCVFWLFLLFGCYMGLFYKK